MATMPGLNQCISVKDSKVYVTSEFHAYPREVIFKCDYLCNSKGKISKVKGTSKVRISNMEDDLTLPVCLGLQLKKVPWGYDFDKLIPFYAPDTEIPELRKWSHENIEFNPQTNPLEKERLIKLKNDLNMISSYFITSGMNGGVALRYFKEAGIEISNIAEKLPMDTTQLDETIRQIIVNRGVIMPANSPESLIYPMILNSASWRIPSI